MPMASGKTIFFDCRLPRDFPLPGKIADMGDVLVRAGAVRFVNARNFEFLHLNVPVFDLVYCRKRRLLQERPHFLTDCNRLSSLLWLGRPSSSTVLVVEVQLNPSGKVF